MNCLAVDTTSSKLIVILIKGDETIEHVREVGRSGHSSLLMPAVQAVLAEAGLAVSELDSVAVVVGPGSFTGIRIGVAAMTALSFAENLKRISVTSFEPIAYDKQKTLAAVDAGHGNAYVARCENGKVVETLFVTSAEAEGMKAEYCPKCDAADALAAVVRQKAENGEFVSVLEPFYMRKSQAEREKDEI